MVHKKSRKRDVAAIPLDNIDSSCCRYAIDLDDPTNDVDVRVRMQIVIIGFPQGLNATAKLPIWKTGNIVSEPDIDFNDLPAMLVDVRTISGMSGSPALIKSIGNYTSAKSGGPVIGRDGVRFLGVYSGRVPIQLGDKATQSDLGIVWKPSVIKEILSQGK